MNSSTTRTATTPPTTLRSSSFASGILLSTSNAGDDGISISARSLHGKYHSRFLIYICRVYLGFLSARFVGIAHSVLVRTIFSLSIPIPLLSNLVSGNGGMLEPP